MQGRGGEWQEAKATQADGTWTLTIPMQRGCGVARLHWAWITPFEPWWTVRPSIEVGTTVAGDTIHCTQDGSPAGAASPVLKHPFTPGGSFTLRAVILADGKPVGEELIADLIEAP